MKVESSSILPETPLVSVVLPAYNAADVIERQLAALARQQVDFEWELLVCDNGSTDATAAVAESWSDRLPIRVVDASARRGPSAARNIGVESARGRYLAFCDADDIVADDWLPKVVAALQNDAFIGVAARYPAFYSTERNPAHITVITHKVPVLEYFPIVGAGHMAIHTDVFRQVGGFDESLRTCEDDDLSWRVQLAGYALVPHPEAVIDITPRSGLIRIFRQAFAWGKGDRQVQHKFQHVIDALARLPRELPPEPEPEPEPEADASDADTAPGPVGQSRIQRVLRSFASPAAAADFALRTYLRLTRTLATVAGTALGHAFGRVDRTMPQLPARIAEEYLGRRDAV